MSQAIEILRSLDRKERFAVLRDALGFDDHAPVLDPDFRDRLRACINVPVPETAFVAMDYHLDWIQIALHLAEGSGIDLDKPFKSPAADQINRNQQDIDLLVAFDAAGTNGPTTHLVMIEAKAYLHWTNGQLDSKTRRLGQIFGDDALRRGILKPHFVLMTGRVSPNIRPCGWPRWTKDGQGSPFWLEYSLPVRRKVTRCGPDGKRDKSGAWLRFDPAAASTG
ncbi:MAG: hypothetical protein OXI73_15410 [Rhodospirillales bacterium]|nr:hypothetical protein [Rhodospirillales bacterium]